ncbi:MAG: ATP-binding protein [ANME-2 cluster archaeon]|nr:ATP-binding protein [ANME-2 cluster archaeon]MBC2700143.1 ATP-binding protein [ANME-2 cluster archaeon]MBC2708759.1 ATP-binding protein [ANME-2 cluster archaeon]
MFKDREDDLVNINKLLESNTFEFIIIYGRRRVGKTELILQATRNTNRIYYLAVGARNLERFYDLCTRQYPEVSKLRMDWEVLFEYLRDRVDVIVIDEFQNMIKEDANILNIFQSVTDTVLTDSRLKLFILGSSVSIITSKVLDYQSPLYGRRTGSIDLKAVSFFDLQKFYPDLNIRELIEIYGFADGIPFYLIKLDDRLWPWLGKETGDKNSFLKDEVDFIMRYEFEDVSTYKLILEAIAYGKTKLGDIKDFMGVKRTDISPYLRNLIEVGMIKREVPITEKAKSRLGRYYISDNFLKFWFRYIYPNVSAIEEGIFDIDLIKHDYNRYLGGIFEHVAKQFLIRNKDEIFNFTRIGKWWHREREIDVVAMNELNGEILFLECNWQDLKHGEAGKILAELADKSGYVQWNNDTRKEYYGILGRKIENKEELRSRGFLAFDLEDF